jgi:hypothetical protein
MSLRKTIQLATLISIVLASPFASAQEGHWKIAPSKLQTMGVHSFTVGIDGEAMWAHLADANGTDIGQVSTTILGDGSREIVVKLSSAAGLTVRWNGRLGVLTLIEDDGRIFSMHKDPETQQIVGDQGAQDALDRHDALLKLAAETTATLMQQRRFIAKTNSMPGDPCGWEDLSCMGDGGGVDLVLGPGAGGGGGTRVVCNGAAVRGTAYAVAGDGIVRSDLCTKATNDANVQCWNQWCIGCCKLEPCDAFCFLGDYFCTQAGVSGTSCSLAQF